MKARKRDHRGEKVLLPSPAHGPRWTGRLSLDREMFRAALKADPYTLADLSVAEAFLLYETYMASIIRRQIPPVQPDSIRRCPRPISTKSVAPFSRQAGCRERNDRRT